jgi:hypothetical protein
MPWNPVLTQLRNVLSDLYPDVVDARTVASTAGLPVSRIVLQGRAVNVWHAILEEAEKQGRVEAVIRVALDEYPSHNGLQAAARAYGVPVEPSGSVGRVATSNPAGQPPSDARGGAGQMDRVVLFDILTNRLSASDLRTLCFALGMDYDDLAGGSKPDKSRELIQYLERRGRLPDLVEELRRWRPDIDLGASSSGGADRPDGRTTNGDSTFVVPGPAKLGTLGGSSAVDKTTILFLASDPTDATRLRLGEEAREIQEKLQLSKLRERFDWQTRWSVRAPDVTQALLDIQPQVVHFSGHGEETDETRGRGEGQRGVKLVSVAGAQVEPNQDIEGGALYFEDPQGKAQRAPAEALAALFEQFADQVQCVVLNACYSEGQAKAIARHIPYVVGMRKAIGDRAAIAFSIGFYQALGAGRTVEQAYKLGCVQIGLQGIPEHLTPVLIKKD